LLWETAPSCQARPGLEDAEEQRKRGRAKQAVGVDRDDAVGQRVQIADVLVGGVVGRVPLLAVTGLIDAEDERRLPQRLAHQFQPPAPQRCHRPVGVG
jgi:hypothetical protein